MAANVSFTGQHLKGPLPAFDPFEKFAQRQIKGGCQSRQMAQPDLARSPLQVGDMDFVDSGLLGQVDLPPAALLAKLADAFSELDADIRGHSSSIDLADALYLVDTLSVGIFPAGVAPVGSAFNSA